MSLKVLAKSGKKVSKNTRNVLSIQKINTWPILDDADSSAFSTLLQKHLQLLKTIHPKLTWSETRALTREQRREKINDFFLGLSPDLVEAHKKAMNLRRDVSIGINDVTRGLEKKEFACCLVSEEAKPKFIVSHVVDLAKLSKVPFLVLNFLKQKTKECLGFSTLAIGFKMSIIKNKTHELHELCSEIINLFIKGYNYESEVTDRIGEDSIVENCLIDVSCGKPAKELPLFPSSPLNLKDIYLYRESTSYRVFKPNECVNSNREKLDDLVESNLQNDEESSERDSEGEGKLFIKRTRYYQAPTVLRVQSNPSKRRKQKKKNK